MTRTGTEAKASMAAHFEALRRIAESNRKARLDSLADSLIRDADLSASLPMVSAPVFADRYAQYLDSMNRPTYAPPRARVS